jgi:alpha-D-ribose 1-methylphosphonate 5-triphosphate diphosphatase
MPEQVFCNAQLVLEGGVLRGTLVSRGGRIAAIEEEGTRAPGAIDLEGDLLIPGLVELHTDNLERHAMPRPGIPWPTEAAALAHDRELAAAGITTSLDSLCLGYVEGQDVRGRLMEELVPALERLAASSALKVEHLLHLRCELSSETLLPQLERLIGHAGARLVSLMDHTPGQRQFRDLDQFRRHYRAKLGLDEAEAEAMLAARIASSARSAASNRSATVTLARQHGVPLASHDDTTPAHVAQSRADGVTIAEFPTTLSAARASHEGGIAVLMGGPNVVRGGSHSGNTSAIDLARAGHLDILSSDYVPASMLMGALRLADEIEGLGLPAAIAAVTRTPALAVGLADRGALAAGLRADLVRVRRAGPTPVIVGVWRGCERIA